MAVSGEVDAGGAHRTQLANAMAAPAGSFFDVAPLHLLTQASLRRLRELQPASLFEVERFRPNVVLEGDAAPFGENEWGGVTVHLGEEVTAPVLIPTMRCIMPTLPQHDLPKDNETLRTLSRHNRIEIPGLGTWSCLGAYAGVATGGRLSVGSTWTA